GSLRVLRLRYIPRPRTLAPAAGIRGPARRLALPTPRGSRPAGPARSSSPAGYRPRAVRPGVCPARSSLLDDLIRALQEALVAPVGVAPLDDEGRSFHVPQLAHALDERFGECIVIRGRRARSRREERQAPRPRLRSGGPGEGGAGGG